MKKLIVILFFTVGIISNSSVFSLNVEKGFEALKEFNYFKAKNIFEKTIKKNTSAASYGLATIYYRKDNPFHSLDSAYSFVINAEKTYGDIKEKRKVQLREIGFDYLNILELRAQISSEFYKIAHNANSVIAYSEFIVKHPWSNELFDATHKRDSIAYANAKVQNTSSAYQSFLNEYTSSSFTEEVQNDFYLSQYHELTKSNLLVSYLDFLAKCPTNPYAKEAEDRVYEIVTVSNSIASFLSFIKTYPNNRNVGAAWRNVYQLYMVDYSDKSIEMFMEEYPTYPYYDELTADLKLMKLKLLPFKKEEYYGYMDYSGNIIIPAEYEQLGLFKEGLALAVKNGKSGFIDKGNRVVVPFIYDAGNDFEQGRSIVESNEYIGMIDRAGNAIFPIEFTDLGVLSEELIYGSKDSLYAFYDKNYNMRMPAKYNEAYSFSNGLAKVQFGENEAFIDPYGTFIIPPGYESISFFNDSLLVFEEEGLFGLMLRNCRVKVQPTYDEIGQLNLGRALVVQEGALGYLNAEGAVVIPMVYETFANYLKRGQFVSNLAIAKQKGKFGIIDLQGKTVVPFVFQELGEVSSLVSFTKGKGWGFIDLTGKIIIQPEFDFAESFKDGFAVVEKLTLQGTIDSKGKIIVPLNFTSIERITDDLLLVSNGSKFGIFANTGAEIVPLDYQQIRLIDKELLLMIAGNEVHYLYLPEKRIIKPNFKGE